ncbi:hypothetical protein [uncultured Empedobacter sp.]|uniref:hypothetical protein n=1 Tax=uncultured Empedobacter sp. TaxID=410844 RepID=UPI0025E7059F|nr:hypothetical protein [uncultured Empedobacter sp.]
MKYDKIYTHQQATQVVLQMRKDLTIFINDSELAKSLQLAKLTFYKRLAFSDWKSHEIENINNYINEINK